MPFGVERFRRQDFAAPLAVAGLLVAVGAVEGIVFPIVPDGVDHDALLLEEPQRLAEPLGKDGPAGVERRAGADVALRFETGVELVGPQGRVACQRGGKRTAGPFEHDHGGAGPLNGEGRVDLFRFQTNVLGQAAGQEGLIELGLLRLGGKVLPRNQRPPRPAGVLERRNVLHDRLIPGEFPGGRFDPLGIKDAAALFFGPDGTRQERGHDADTAGSKKIASAQRSSHGFCPHRPLH